MQSNLRLMMWTIVAVVAAWFVAMTIDIHVFLHSDVDDVVSGTIPMNRTDIGARCGAEYTNSSEFVYFKLNAENQLIFLCPQGLSPIRTQVVAQVIPDAFRKSLTPQEATRLNQAIPQQAVAVTPAPAAEPSAVVAAPEGTTPTTVPAEQIPATPPAPTVAPAPTPTAAPAAVPAQTPPS